MSRFINPVPQYKPFSKLFFFESGTNDQLTTFKDSSETIENTHPVLTDPAGFVPNIFFSGAAKLVVLDAGDVQYIERDPVGGENELGNFSSWSALITYDSNDIVEGSDGRYYQSFSGGNLDNDPTLTPTAWLEVRFIEVWNTNKSYSIGDIVQTTDGSLWKSVINANSGNDPSTGDGSKWLPAFKVDKSVVPKVSAATLSISSPNELQDGSEFVMPLANSVPANWYIDVEQPLTFSLFNPSLVVSGSDLFTDSVGTDTTITFVQPTTIRLTSNGVDRWRI